MLNLLTKKITPKLIFQHLCRNSNYYDLPQGWFQIQQDTQHKVESKDIKKPQPWSFPNNLNFLTSNNTTISNEQPVQNLHNWHQDNSTNSSKNQKKSKLTKTELNKRTIDQTMNLFYQTTAKAKVNKFCRNTNLIIKMQNAEKIVDTLSCILKQSQQKQFLALIKNFINTQGFKQGSIPQKPTQKQKQLFKKVQNSLLDSIQDPDAVRQLMKMFSQTNPNFIQLSEIKKNNQSQMAAVHMDNRKINKIDVFKYKQKSQPINSQLPIKNTNKLSQKKRNDTFEFIKSLQKKQRDQKPKIANLKLFLIKEPQVNQFKVDEASLMQVQKKIFGNKKMISQHIVFKRDTNNSNAKFNNYGQNWVYAYDLPYQFCKQNALQLIKVISNRYGQITEFIAESYQNFVEKNKSQTIFLVPQNFNNQTTKNRVKIEKYQQNVRQIDQESKKQKPNLVSKILKKAKNQKQLQLNKSTMVFRFKNKQDKIKFLTHEMRLYGLCLEKMKNIRFEQAQSKNVVALSMVPWGCHSSQLAKFISDALTSLQITLTHPKCIIVKGYIFIQFLNFYEALYSKNLLNNMVFQNQRLKAQLSYGSSYVYEGQFKYNFELDHYEQLVKKLTNIRSQHRDMLN